MELSRLRNAINILIIAGVVYLLSLASSRELYEKSLTWENVDVLSELITLEIADVAEQRSFPITIRYSDILNNWIWERPNLIGGHAFIYDENASSVNSHSEVGYNIRRRRGNSVHCKVINLTSADHLVTTPLNQKVFTLGGYDMPSKFKYDVMAFSKCGFTFSRSPVFVRFFSEETDEHYYLFPKEYLGLLDFHQKSYLDQSFLRETWQIPSDHAGFRIIEETGDYIFLTGTHLEINLLRHMGGFTHKSYRKGELAIANGEYANTVIPNAQIAGINTELSILVKFGPLLLVYYLWIVNRNICYPAITNNIGYWVVLDRDTLVAKFFSGLYSSLPAILTFAIIMIYPFSTGQKIIIPNKAVISFLPNFTIDNASFTQFLEAGMLFPEFGWRSFGYIPSILLLLLIPIFWLALNASIRLWTLPNCASFSVFTDNKSKKKLNNESRISHQTTRRFNRTTRQRSKK